MTKNRRAALFLCLSLLAALLALWASGCGRPKQPLTITAAFPAAGATGVPSDSAVELTFSAPPEKLDDYFTVEPPVEGRFQYMDNVVAFLPGLSEAENSRWEEGTTYTVTVKAGLPGKESTPLAQDFTLSFTAGDGSIQGYPVSTPHETFLPGDYPVIDIDSRYKSSYQWHFSPEEVFSVTVHQLEDGQRYLRELYRSNAIHSEVRVDTTGLPEVLTFTQTAEEARLSADDSQRADIVFPESLPAGWYVATLTSSKENVPPVQKLLQIQESAVYAQIHNGQSLFWFNSTADGKPVPGAKLSVFRDPFASTQPELSAQGGEDGIVTLDLSSIDIQEDQWPSVNDYTPYIFYSLTAPDGTTYYDAFSPWSFQDSHTYDQDYYGFLYTDRTIYRQDDTIRFWGTAKPRKNAPLPGAVSVELHRDYDGGPVQTVEVAVSPDGVFTGELSYQNYASGWMELRVYPAGERDEQYSGWSYLASVYLDIARYKKPLYTAGITTDKLYYRPREIIQAETTVTLFDRTPAAGMEMNISGGDYGEPKAYTTGEDGVIRTQHQAVANHYNNWGWYPNSYTLRAENNDASDVNLSVYDEVYVFPTTVMVEAEEQRDGGKSDLVITANQIAFDRIPGGRQIIQDYESLRGPGAQVGVTVELHKVTHTKVELAPVYDRYTKKSVPRAVWQRSEEIVRTIQQQTGPDGVLRIPDILPPEEPNSRYYVDISVTDGGYQQTSLGLGSSWDWNQEEAAGHFHTFNVVTSQTDNEFGGKGWFDYRYTYFRFGEEARYRVMDRGAPVTEGTVMVNLLQDTILQSGIGGTSGTILCDEEKLPDFTLCGAYFDGRRIYPINSIRFMVVPESRALTLQILPEQEDYRPGDTAQVTLRALDENGRPAPDVNVCLGVVDESIFALREQYINLSYDFYGSVFFAYPQVFTSYIQHGVELYYNGDGGKGGGGGGGDTLSIRENFKDTAAFVSGKTGADGTLTATVSLPDNLTQWRLTAVAMDSRAWWGYSKSQLYTTLPFRIDPILSSTFLTGDTIACTVRGFGTGITTQDEVLYTATIEGYGEELEATAEAPAGELVPLSFQKLPAGDYTMTVTALCGDYSDGVRVPFTVRESALVFPIHRETDPNRVLEEVQPTQWPVELEIYSQGQRSFMRAWRLLNWDQSGRGDVKLAMSAVRDAVTAAFGEGYQHPADDLDGVQTTYEDGKGQTGGIRIFPYADPDIVLTAKAAVVAPDRVDRYQLYSFLSNAFSKTEDPEHRAAALMGLSALDRLDEDQELLLRTRARTDGLPAREKLYLIAGLSYLDQAEAQKLYAKELAPQLAQDRYGLRLPGATGYETVENTAGALLCAVLTGAAEDAEQLVDYLAQQGTNGYGSMRGPCQLDIALYLNRFQQKEGQQPVIGYTKDGQRHTVTLTASSCLNLTLSEEDFAALDLSAEGGPAIASVSYYGGPEQLGFTPSPRVTVTKTLDTPEDQKRLGGETTITIRVELDPQMPYGSYKLVEWVPSNMRLRSVKTESGRRYFSWRTDEQLLTVDFGYHKGYSNVFTFQYTATSVLDTECTLERSYAYCTETMEGGRTEKGDFLPSDYYYLGVGYLFRKT